MRTLSTFDQRHTNISCKDWLRPLGGNELSQHINGVVFSNIDTLKGCRKAKVLLWFPTCSYCSAAPKFSSRSCSQPFSREKCCPEVLTKLLSGETVHNHFRHGRDESWVVTVHIQDLSLEYLTLLFDTFWHNSCWTDLKPSAVSSCDLVLVFNHWCEVDGLSPSLEEFKSTAALACPYQSMLQCESFTGCCELSTHSYTWSHMIQGPSWDDWKPQSWRKSQQFRNRKLRFKWMISTDSFRFTTSKCPTAMVCESVTLSVAESQAVLPLWKIETSTHGEAMWLECLSHSALPALLPVPKNSQKWRARP